MCRVPSIRSFIRFRVRRNVDLPQPDGPIRAATEHSGITTATSYRARVEPYQNDSPRTSNFGRTPFRSDSSRPVTLRSERMAE